MKKILILISTSILGASTVWAYCYQLDPYSYNNCIQQENYNRQIQQMYQQQSQIQQLQMYEQRKLQKQQINLQKQLLQQQQIYNQFIPYNYNYRNDFTGNANSL